MIRVCINGERRAIAAVLVDLDNTLVDRDHAVRAWLCGRGHHEAAARLDGAHLSLVALAAELVESRRERGRRTAELAAEIRAALPSLLPPADAARTALAELGAAGIRVALVTNGGGATQRAKLAAAALDPASFAAICISAERRVAKPSAEIFALALAELGVEAGAAVMIGDSPEHDVGGARAAGVASCWISRGRRFPAGLARPDHVVADFCAASRWLLRSDPAEAG